MRQAPSLSPSRGLSRSPPPVPAGPSPYFVVADKPVPPRSPSLSLNALTHSHAPHPNPHPPTAGVVTTPPAQSSRPSSPTRWLSSGPPSPTKSLASEGGLFERDIEFSPAHVLSASAPFGP